MHCAMASFYHSIWLLSSGLHRTILYSKSGGGGEGTDGIGEELEVNGKENVYKIVRRSHT